MNKKSDEQIVQIALQIMKESPGTSKQKALRHAKDISKQRGRYKVTSSEKPSTSCRTDFDDLPPHVQRNIVRVNKAAAERKAAGRSLPSKNVVQGGAPGLGKGK